MQASIGIATVAPGATVDSVLRDADVAMYAAKERGKAGHVRYVPGMEEPVLAHIQLGGEIRRGLDAGEFRVVYQPLVALGTGRIVGVEALVRWNHPIRGTVPPIEFIPAAERTGLIVELGRFVLRETCLADRGLAGRVRPRRVAAAQPSTSRPGSCTTRTSSPTCWRRSPTTGCRPTAWCWS
nr:hypothetical protein GCM10020092_042230 [Actinoplanes digitatis]